VVGDEPVLWVLMSVVVALGVDPPLVSEGEVLWSSLFVVETHANKVH
jgi:hypothetical protein